MTQFVKILFLLIALAGVGGLGYWYGHRQATTIAKGESKEPTDAKPGEKPDGDKGDKADGEHAKEAEVVATVRTVPLRRGTITETVTAYGTVVAQQGEMRIVSVPFEARVRQMLVTPGQQVSSRQTLVRIEPSADTQLQMRQARNAVANARRDFEQVKQRREQKLATNQEYFTSEQTLQDAQLKLDSLTERGADSPRRALVAEDAGMAGPLLGEWRLGWWRWRVRGEATGLIGKVDVQEGQVVPAGTPLVEIAAGNRIEVKLGVEPDDIPHLHVDQAVRLYPVQGAADEGADGIEGTIRLITQKVNPDTRLVDVFVKITEPDAKQDAKQSSKEPPRATPLLEAYVRAELPIASADAFIVPRDAALPGEKAFTLYTVGGEAGKLHAVEHEVTIGLENDKEVEVKGEGLQEGQPVVVVGNYELKKDMAVIVEKAEEKPATTEASTRPAAAEKEGKPDPKAAKKADEEPEEKASEKASPKAGGKTP